MTSEKKKTVNFFLESLKRLQVNSKEQILHFPLSKRGGDTTNASMNSKRL